jgi:hypothetical protein
MAIRELKKSEIRESITNERYKAKLEELTIKVEPALTRTTNTLLNFTDHSLEHSLGVEKAYGIILNNNFTSLSDDEKFVLIAATLLHDIGMVGQQSDFQITDYDSFRRDAHQHFSKERIFSESLTLNLDPTDARIIADIAEAHRKVPFESLPESIAYGIGGQIRIRLLAALLRFADELHVTKERTNNFMTNILQPDEDSLKHHRRHEHITGVTHNNENSIVISAYADDWEMEKLVEEMIGEIQSKLEQVRLIFEENEILIKEVILQLQCEDIITKEIFLILAKSPKTQEEIISNLPNRNPDVVKKVLSVLSTTRIISVNMDDLKYKLGSSERVCKIVFNALKKTDRILNFIQSDYLHNVIGDIFDNIALNIYGFRSSDGDREDRLLLVRNSPAVLDHLLNKQDMDPHFAHLDRSVIMDLIILNGFMQDITKNPSLLTDSETKFAMQAIQNNLHKELVPFLTFVENLQEEPQHIAQKMLQEQIEIEKKN